MVMLDICTILVAVRRGPKRRDFDNFLAKPDVRKPKPPADQAAVEEQLADLLWGRVGGDIKILGFATEQEVAYTPAGEVAPIPAGLQPVEHFEGIFIDVLTADAVLSTLYNPGFHSA